MDDEKPVSLAERIGDAIRDCPDLLDETRLMGDIFAAVTAGADFTPPEPGAEHTPAQALAYLLDLPADQRLQRLGGLLDSARVGAQCELVDHVGQIAELKAEIRASGDYERPTG